MHAASAQVTRAPPPELRIAAAVRECKSDEGMRRCRYSIQVRVLVEQGFKRPFARLRPSSWLTHFGPFAFVQIRNPASSLPFQNSKAVECVHNYTLNLSPCLPPATSRLIMTIDLRFFPHIIDMILSHSSFEVLRTFYDMSTRYEQCVLPFFLKHISISLQEDGSGALDRLDTSVNFVGFGQVH